MENVIFVENLEMLNKIIDGPGLKTSSIWFATKLMCMQNTKISRSEMKKKWNRYI